MAGTIFQIPEEFGIPETTPSCRKPPKMFVCTRSTKTISQLIQADRLHTIKNDASNDSVTSNLAPIVNVQLIAPRGQKNSHSKQILELWICTRLEVSPENWVH